MGVFRCLKTKLKQVCIDKTTTSIINRVVCDAHRTTTHTYRLITDFYIANPHRIVGMNQTIVNTFISCLTVFRFDKPRLDETDKFINLAHSATTKSFRHLLLNHYCIYYEPTMVRECDTMSNALRQSIATEVLTNIENNVKSHFKKHLTNFVMVALDLNTKKTAKKYVDMVLERKVIARLNLINTHRNPRLPHLIPRSPRQLRHTRMSKEHKSLCILAFFVTRMMPGLPPRAAEKWEDDLNTRPMHYMKCMFDMGRYCQSEGRKSLRVFPEASSIPGHINFHTETIRQTGIVNRDQGFDDLFDLSDSVFKSSPLSGFSFYNSVDTDGVSISVVHKQRDGYYRKDPKYIGYLTRKRLGLKHGPLIAVDPNFRDMWYAAKRGTNGIETFRLTSVEKRKMCHGKKRREQGRKRAIALWSYTSKEEHNKYSSNALTPYRYHNYLFYANKLFEDMFEYNCRIHHRQQRFQAYHDRQLYEDVIYSRFRKFAGKDAIICVGDYSNQNHLKRQQDPFMGKYLRRLFHRLGFRVYLINEAFTSKRCCRCKKHDATCTPFSRREKHPNPSRELDPRYPNLKWGYTRCSWCYTCWNRDKNSATNILLIAESIRDGRQRPTHLCRPPLLIPPPFPQYLVYDNILDEWVYQPPHRLEPVLPPPLFNLAGHARVDNRPDLTHREWVRDMLIIDDFTLYFNDDEVDNMLDINSE